MWGNPSLYDVLQWGIGTNLQLEQELVVSLTNLDEPVEQYGPHARLELWVSVEHVAVAHVVFLLLEHHLPHLLRVGPVEVWQWRVAHGGGRREEVLKAEAGHGGGSGEQLLLRGALLPSGAQ